MTMTKYEHELMMQEERKKRSGNIEELKKQIEENKDLLAVMPHFSVGTFEQGKDWRFMADRLKWLEELLADEQKAFNATFQATEAEAAQFINAQRRSGAL